MSSVSEKAAEIKHTGIARVLTAFLEERLEERTKQLITIKDSESLRQLQGRAQELNELIKYFTSEKSK